MLCRQTSILTSLNCISFYSTSNKPILHSFFGKKIFDPYSQKQNHIEIPLTAEIVPPCIFVSFYSTHPHPGPGIFFFQKCQKLGCPSRSPSRLLLPPLETLFILTTTRHLKGCERDIWCFSTCCIRKRAPLPHPSLGIPPSLSHMKFSSSNKHTQSYMTSPYTPTTRFTSTSCVNYVLLCTAIYTTI